MTKIEKQYLDHSCQLSAEDGCETCDKYFEQIEQQKKDDVFVKMGLTKDPIANQLNKLFVDITNSFK